MSSTDFDDLDFLPGATTQGNRADEVKASVDAAATLKTFTETCRKCGGSGVYGRFGTCFACKGKGKFTYKTSPADRAKARQQRQDREDRKRTDRMEVFKAEHPAEHAWMIRAGGRFDFALKMLQAVAEYGHLSDGQMAAVRKCMLRDAERDQERARRAEGVALDVTGLDRAFATARQNGAKRATLRTETITFSLANASGKNPGAIYAKRRDGEYLGKIVDGTFKPSFACTEADKEAVAAASVDPKAAALRYAEITKECAICGIELTDPDSVKRGIGPICASKFGF